MPPLHISIYIVIIQKNDFMEVLYVQNRNRFGRY